jgi:DNA mismatch repair protein MutL
MVMGEDFSNHRVLIAAQKENLSLTGFISRPEFTKSNSKSIYLFVNKRFVRDNSVTHAVLSAYRQIIEPRRYPAAVLFLDLPPEDVDVNVHPAKMEVRFKDSHSVYDLVSKTITQSLSGAETSKGNFIYRLATKESTSASVPRYTRSADKISSKSFGLFSRQNLQQAITNDLLTRSSVAEKIATFNSDNVGTKETITFASLRYLGQFANTYLVFAGDDGLILLDQHAAHERIILERLKKTMGPQIISQSLLMPEIVNLIPGQITLFAGYIDFLREIGLEIEIFGRDAIVVKTLPAILSQGQAREIISDIADQLGEQNQMPSLQEKKEKILVSLACRAAIKANSVLTSEEVAALCRDLEETPFNLTCPHGRPITINFSLSEIERMFKRK